MAFIPPLSLLTYLDLSLSLDFNDDDLEAELLAMTGGGGASKGNKKKKEGSGGVSLADVDKMVASAHMIGEEENDDEEGSDIDDSELLAELVRRTYCTCTIHWNLSIRAPFNKGHLLFSQMSTF